MITANPHLLMPLRPAAEQNALLDRAFTPLPADRQTAAGQTARAACNALAASSRLAAGPEAAGHSGASAPYSAALGTVAGELRVIFQDAAAYAAGTSPEQWAPHLDQVRRRANVYAGSQGVVLDSTLRVLLPLIAARCFGAGSLREAVTLCSDPLSTPAETSLITGFALPTLIEGRARGLGERSARVDALLAIMARHHDDTASENGRLALRMLRWDAAVALEAGGHASEEGLRRCTDLRDTIHFYKIVPMGGVGLFAVTLFLDGLLAP
ncbi:triphosphoribosyl-dephospho-CoA synthase [Streptomyces boluensis]|uniref:Triphosphoribosyl-dephospho-CoA synthase n=1 Tax=Streptomyces boluensis TaxID=1775135 RepID=A0A964UTA8_9ACTN|nr:triphosphoribosyl-dephospho-CoA synthase [Streptomyces boluensis]NBE55034.1 hypothetical protein [Streptomyces boluensis]